MKHYLISIAVAFASILVIPAESQTVAQLQAEITAQQAQITVLQQYITEINGTVNNGHFSNEIADMRTQAAKDEVRISAVQQQIYLIASNPVLALGSFVSVNTTPVNGVVPPTVVFTGCNLQVVDGIRQTSLTNGTGNILIGYENYSPAVYGTLNRMGSHNLILGRLNQWSAAAFSSIVAGDSNEVLNESSILGGTNNYANGNLSVILGGFGNTTGNTGVLSTITGGKDVEALTAIQP
jgi:hypothetical protein